MATIAAACPACQTRGSIPDTLVGKQVKCPKCGKPFTVAAEGATSKSANGTVKKPIPSSADGTVKKPASSSADGTVKNPTSKSADGSKKAAPPPPAAAAAADTLEVRCQCGGVGRVPVSFAGKQVKCRTCSQPVLVPGLKKEAPPPRKAPPKDDVDLVADDEIEVIDDDIEVVDDGIEVVDDFEVVDEAAVIIDAKCPNCGKEGTLSEQFVGRRINCPKCKEPFTVTDPNRPAPSAPPPKPASAKRKSAETMDGRKSTDTVEESVPAKPRRPKEAVPEAPWAAAETAEEPAPEEYAAAVFAFDLNAPPVTVASSPSPEPAAAGSEAPAVVPKYKAAKKPAPSVGKPGALDIAALSAAVLALIVSWVPGLGIVGILCGVLGIVLGGIAIIIASTKKPPSLLWPISGTAVSGLGLVLALALTLTGEPETPPVAIKRPNTTPADSVKPDTQPETKPEPPPEKKPDTQPEKKPELPPEKKPEPPPEKKPEPPPEKKPEPPAGTWVNVGESPVRVGDVQVRVTAAHVDFVKSKGRVSAERYLIVHCDVENLSATDKITYRGWGAGKPPAEGVVGTLRVAAGKPVERVVIPNMAVDAQVQDVPIGPGQTVSDLLFFPPPAGTDPIRIELPGAYVGRPDAFRMELPATMVVVAVPDKNPISVDPLKDPAPKPADEAKLKELRAGLKHRLSAKRIESLNIIGKLGGAALPLLPDVMKTVQDPDSQVRVAAVQAIGEFGPASKDAVPALKEALKDEFWKVKAEAARALGKIGPDAKDAVPALTNLLKSKDEEVPQRAGEALRLIQPKGKK
jgi:uncharacterized protein (DUF983 family)